AQLEGLVMATRSGTVDPGLVLWLEQHEDLSPDVVANALEHRSGLLALAGTADMREVQARAVAGDEAAGLAFDVFIHRLATRIGAMAAAAGRPAPARFRRGRRARRARVHRRHR